MAMITERGIKGDLCDVLFVWEKYFSIYHIALCVVELDKKIIDAKSSDGSYKE